MQKCIKDPLSGQRLCFPSQKDKAVYAVFIHNPEDT